MEKIYWLAVSIGMVALETGRHVFCSPDASTCAVSDKQKAHGSDEASVDKSTKMSTETWLHVHLEWTS